MNRFVAAFCSAAMTLSLGGCFGQSKDITKYMEEARAAIESGASAKATVPLQAALKIAPTNPQANLALAKIEDARGDLNAAVPHYLFAAAPDARLLEPQLRVVEILMDSGRLQEASGRMNATLGSFPANPEALALSADLKERQGKTEAARSDANAALAKTSTLPRALAVLAMIQLRQGNTQEAIEILGRGLRAHPDDLRLLQVQAAALLAANQPDQAVTALRTITRMAPRNVLAQSALADVDAANGHAEEAVAAFRAAVTADPGNQPMQLAFIDFLKRHGPAGSLSSYLDQLIAQNPQSGTFDLVLAEYDRSEGRLEDSKRVLEAAAGRLKDSSEALTVKVALAKILSSGSRNDLAASLLDDILKADPQNADARTFRAALQVENGRPSAAISDLLQVLAKNPVDGRAFQVLATAYMAQGEPKLAIDAMRRATALSPTDEGTQIRLAAFLQAGGAVDAARDVMARLTLQNPNIPEVWAADTRLAVDRKDWGTANRSLNRYRDLAGNDAQANVLDGQIKVAQEQNAGAMQAFQAAINANTNIDADIVGLFARAAVGAKKPDAAADYLQARAPALKSDTAFGAQLVVMTLRADAGQFDKVSAAFDKAAQLSPRKIDPYRIYVSILLTQNRLDDARQVLDQAVRAGVPAWSTAMLKGYIDEVANDRPAAMAAYKQALADNPLSVNAANNYASLLADLQPQNKDALTEARDRLVGLEASPDLGLIDTIAWLDYRLGRFDEAKSLLGRLNAAGSDNPQIRFHAAAVMLASGDKAGAQTVLDTVKGLNFPGADEARTLSAS